VIDTRETSETIADLLAVSDTLRNRSKHVRLEAHYSSQQLRLALARCERDNPGPLAATPRTIKISFGFLDWLES